VATPVRETRDLKVPPTSTGSTVKAIEARREAPVPPKPASAGEGGDLKEAFLAEIRKHKKFFHGTVVAQAARIDLEGDRFVFAFGPQHKALRAQLEQNRPWLEETASQLAGRKIAVVSAEGPSSPAGGAPSARAADFGETGAAKAAAPGGDQKQALKDRAMSDASVQNMLDVFAAEIKDV